MGLPVLTDSLQHYLVEINRYPLLTPDEEFRIAERYYRDRNIEDAHRLVTSNLKYVVKIALEYRNYGCRLADLIQEGNIGLMTAVKKFDPYRGFRLITYAKWWIKAFIQDFILKTTGLVKRGTKALKRKLFYRKDPATASNAGDDERGRDISINSDIDAVSEFSLNSSLSGDEKTTHLDLLRDGGPSQEEAVMYKEEKAIMGKEIGEAMAVLNDRERLVIEKRVMAEEPESLQGLGVRLGLTRERVRQIESEALRKLGMRLNPESSGAPASTPRDA